MRLALALLLCAPAAAQDWLQFIPPDSFGSQNERVVAAAADPTSSRTELAACVVGVGGASDDRIEFYDLDSAGLLRSIGRVVPSGPPLGEIGSHGVRIDHDGDRLAVGVRDLMSRGRVLLFRRVGATWVEDGVIQGVPGLGVIGFDTPDLEGDRLLVTQQTGWQDDAYAHTFVRGATGWQFEGTIPLGRPAQYRNWSVALAGGRLVVVGTPHNGLSRADVHEWTGAAWQVVDSRVAGPNTVLMGEIAVDGRHVIFHEVRVSTQGYLLGPSQLRVLVHAMNANGALTEIQRIDPRPPNSFPSTYWSLSPTSASGRELLVHVADRSLTQRYRWNGAGYEHVAGYRTQGGFGYGGPYLVVPGLMEDRTVIAQGGLYLFDDDPIGSTEYVCATGYPLWFLGYGGSSQISTGDFRVVFSSHTNGQSPGGSLFVSLQPGAPTGAPASLCLGGPLRRIELGTVSSSMTSYLVDWQLASTSLAQLATAGTTLYFQYGAPDPAAPGGARFSDAFGVTFAP